MNGSLLSRKSWWYLATCRAAWALQPRTCRTTPRSAAPDAEHEPVSARRPRPPPVQRTRPRAPRAPRACSARPQPGRFAQLRCASSTTPTTPCYVDAWPRKRPDQQHTRGVGCFSGMLGIASAIPPTRPPVSDTVHWFCPKRPTYRSPSGGPRLWGV